MTFIFQLIDENKDNMINFKEFVYILGVVCKADLTHKLKLLYICHQPPALLPTDKLDETVSPLSSKLFYHVMYVRKRQAQQCSGFKQVNGITPPPFAEFLKFVYDCRTIGPTLYQFLLNLLVFCQT